MPASFRKKNTRLRGSHTHGWGMRKKHRGAGSRGGKGQAGYLKHKKSWMIKNDPTHFGRVGFKMPDAGRFEVKAISLRDLDVLARRNGKKEIDVSEFGYAKVLSSGHLTQPLTVKADFVVERARAKIEKAGGKVITKEAK